MSAKAWLGNRVGGNGIKRRPLVFESGKKHRSLFRQSQKSQTLGILAFETAKIMSRLVSLHKSLTDDELRKLQNHTLRREGVSYLISADLDYLLQLACMEKTEDLDGIAVVVARLGRNCSDPDLVEFERVYTDVKLKLIDVSHFSESRMVDKVIPKLEKFVSDTKELYSGLEALSGMEMTERKIKQWNQNQSQNASVTQKYKEIPPKANYDLFESKLAWHRQQVRHLRQVSLWGKTFNKTVRLMAKAVCIIYSRMCNVFSPYISNRQTNLRHTRMASQPNLQSFFMDRPVDNRTRGRTKSGPIPGTDSGLYDHACSGGGSTLMKQAGPSTAGGSGLALRYANVVLIVDKYMKSQQSVEESLRENLYQMLPASIRRLVKSKLKKFANKEVEQSGDESLAEGWREGLKRILGWLTPMAQDTIMWQMERNVEKQNFDPKPKVLLVQTFFFADREKSEAAIAEILVGLTCICRYKTRHS